MEQAEPSEQPRGKPQTVQEAVSRLRTLIPPVIWAEQFDNPVWSDIEQRGDASLDEIMVKHLTLSHATIHCSLRYWLAAYVINLVCQGLCRQISPDRDMVARLRIVPDTIRRLLRESLMATDRELRGEPLSADESKLLQDTVSRVVNFVKMDLGVPVETTDYNQPFVRLP